ncbi:YdcF family protein [Pontibacillus yanchengensis]|uniref:YdcF family protein n=2 Tax=Pontibacillus yanchengensis TaxID=462910 RepID=A0ACC7VGQ3_9BACI|nr:YdcF family protein [Pontibacillus yanchengensis]MYL33629.1 YdcF family protein [Pontibacillus yanchengensis]MYL54143.1 YdcF family protein [Pontibacillus yanchengensis]
MKKIFGFLLLAMFAYVLYSGYSMWTYSTNYPPEHTDAAIVLGAAAYHDDPSPVFEERIKHGLKLYKDDYVDKLVFTGGKGSGAAYAEAEVAKMYAIEHGVPESDIVIETSSTITEENLKNAKSKGDTSKIDSYTIVSDPFHTKRALAMAHNLNMDAIASPTKTSKYKSLETKVPFFLREWAFYLGYEAASFIR